MKLYQWDPVSGETRIGERVGGERDDVRRGMRNVRGGYDGSAGLVRRVEGMGTRAVMVEHGASHSSHWGPPQKKIYPNKTPQYILAYCYVL
jgi:hypothetical protein